MLQQYKQVCDSNELRLSFWLLHLVNRYYALAVQKANSNSKFAEVLDTFERVML